MPEFQYHPDVLTQFPNVVGGIIVAREMKNGPTPPDLMAAYNAEQKATLARLAGTQLSDLPSLSAWRSAFRKFGAEPTKHRSAAEALLRRLEKKGDIPSINMLVDVANLVSIRYGLPIAAVDTRAVQGPITVHFADGTEGFRELGHEEIEHPEVGEVIFSDTAKMVVARRWCWRQSMESAAVEETTDAIITIEAQHEGGRVDVEKAVADLLELLPKYAGGEYSSYILDAN